MKKIFCAFLTVCFLAAVTLTPVKVLASEKGHLEPSPKSTGEIHVNLLVAAIDPTLTSLDDKPFWNGKNEIRASEYLGFSFDKSLSEWCAVFEEASHQTVKFNVVDKVIIDEFPKYKSIASLDNESYQALFEKDAFGYGNTGGVFKQEYRQYDTCGDLDYDYYVEKLDLVNRKNANEFDMLYLIGIDPLSPFETCMVGNAPLWINGEGVIADCDNFVIATVTFSRFDGSIENIGHMAENMLGYTYGAVPYAPGILDGTNYSELNDWQKYCLCKFLATPETETYGYGVVHFSPNSTSDYDWENPDKVKYYKDWKNGTDVQEFSPDECYLDDPQFSYDRDPCISHHRWWFYNMPYEDGRDKKGYFNNWWRYIFTPYYVTDLLHDKTLGPEVSLSIGERVPLKFTVQYYGGKEILTDPAESAAIVTVNGGDSFTYENGEIVGLKEGYGNIICSIDGKTVKYLVTVRDPAKAPAETPDATSGNASENVPAEQTVAPSGGFQPPVLIILLAVLGISILMVVIFIKIHRSRS